MAQNKIEKRQELLSTLFVLRERSLRELLVLEANENLVDMFDNPAWLTASLEVYHKSHRLLGAEQSQQPIENGFPPSNNISDENIQPTKASLSSPNKTAGQISESPKSPSSSLAQQNNSTEEITAKDTEIIKRVSALQKEGLWNAKRLLKIPEPPRNKTHQYVFFFSILFS